MQRIETKFAQRGPTAFVSLHSSVLSTKCNFDFQEGDRFLNELQETLHKLVCRIGMKADMLFTVAVSQDNSEIGLTHQIKSQIQEFVL